MAKYAKDEVAEARINLAGGGVMAKYAKDEVAEARINLAGLLRPCKLMEEANPHEKVTPQTVYLLVRAVARSGMSRVVSAYVVDANGALVCLDHSIARVCGWSRDFRHGGGVRVAGCGIDIGFRMLDRAVHAVWNKWETRGANDFRRNYI